MRLLTVSNNEELSLVERVGNDIPPYAILSHTWGADNDEVSYKDLVDGRYKDKKGFLKLDFCRKRVAVDNLDLFWVDTCCIDKSSSAELTEAINSMFRWYQGAARCYVFLSDVTVTTNLASDAWRQALRNSRWFRRGWTLQELIAPTVVDFFDSNGTHLGDKRSLFHVIHEVTKLPLDAVRGRSLNEFSVDVRLSWAEGRETKREEDAAYSLLGIFDVYMPLIYGEGRQRAFRRLLKELSELGEPSWWSTQPAIQNLQQGQNFKSQVPQAIGSSTETTVFEKYDPVNTTSHRGRIALMPMWPGDCIRTTHSKKYVKQRNSVSDAAKTGRWSEVLELLDLATEDYGENWSNVVRLRSPHEASRLSFWTILHQAAYVRAPKNIVKHLIERGSLRKVASLNYHCRLLTAVKGTLRTRKTDFHFRHQDITAADIARESKHVDLAGILAPVINHAVPHQTLARLESQFHEIIRADLGVRVTHLVLPDLVALTELKVPEMWFPVGEQGDTKKPVGYIYKLEDRTLVVTKLGLEGEAPKIYKIE